MAKIGLGHAHFEVRDLDRSIDFYARFLDLKLVKRVGNQYAFLSTSGFLHEIALNRVDENATQPASDAVGLCHVAFEVAVATSPGIQ
jgi:catechol-2,3-dioxygenase